MRGLLGRPSKVHLSHVYISSGEFQLSVEAYSDNSEGIKVGTQTKANQTINVQQGIVAQPYEDIYVTELDQPLNISINVSAGRI